MKCVDITTEMITDILICCYIKYNIIIGATTTTKSDMCAADISIQNIIQNKIGKQTRKQSAFYVLK